MRFASNVCSIGKPEVGCIKLNFYIVRELYSTDFKKHLGWLQPDGIKPGPELNITLKS